MTAVANKEIVSQWFVEFQLLSQKDTQNGNDFKMEIVIYHLTSKTSQGSPSISYWSGLWVAVNRIPRASLRRKECIKGTCGWKGNLVLRFSLPIKGLEVILSEPVCRLWYRDPCNIPNWPKFRLIKILMSKNHLWPF